MTASVASAQAVGGLAGLETAHCELANVALSGPAPQRHHAGPYPCHHLCPSHSQCLFYCLDPRTRLAWRLANDYPFESIQLDQQILLNQR